MPELDADFAKALGIADGDLVKMRDEVRANLEREVKKRLQAKVKNQVMDVLLEVNRSTCPRRWSSSSPGRWRRTPARTCESRGMDEEHAGRASWFTDQATRRVKLGLVLAELVKAKDLHAKPEQVRAIVEDSPQTFEDPKEVVRWYY